MKVLTVVSHPRVDSLTFAVAARFVEGLADAGHETEVLDLHRIGFNPVLWEADEPDWAGEKIYSAEVQAEMERMSRYDALAYIFPVWWYSVPAMLKGYIDRVWNKDFAYGDKKLPHKQVLWLGLAADSKEHMAKRQYEQMMNQHLNVSIADYCGISNSRVELLYDTLSSKPEVREELLSHAYRLGLGYENKL